MRTGGSASHPIEGHEAVTFGDECPGDWCKGQGIAVHQAIIPMVDDGGDIVLPQWYSLCCVCHTEQYIKKYGIENVLPCGCQDVDLQAMARAQRSERDARQAASDAFEDAKVREFREQLARDRAIREGTQAVEIVGN